MKVLVATDKPFAKVAIEGIRQELDGVDYELVLLEKYTEKKQLLDAVADVDAMIVRSDIIDEEVIQAGKNLKIVVRAGAGYDNIDLKAATQAGVCVMNTPGQNSNAVAELVFGLLVMGVYSSFFTSLNYLPCFFSQSIKFSSVSYINSCAFVMFCIKH